MLRIKFRELIAYMLVAIFAVGLAFSISLKVLKPASSQEVESSAEEAVVPMAEGEDEQEGTVAEGDSAPSEPLILPQFPTEGTVGTARSVEVFLEPFIYDEKDRRDPFLQVGEAKEGTAIALTALQKYSLESIKLIGIMWDIKNPKAMFVDPASQVHVLGPDESIGNKNGYVAIIREGEVVVVEAERDEAGLNYLTKVLKISR